MERSKLGLLLIKIESTYNTDPTPAASANIIAVTREGVNWKQPGEEIVRNMLDGGYGKAVGPTAQPHASFSFRTELRGNRTTGASNSDISSGEVANLIPLDPLFRAADMPPTYVAESSDGARDGYALYTPTIPTSQGGLGESVTAYFYSEQKVYKATGCKADFSLVFEAGKLPYIDWTLMGNWVAPGDSSIPGSQTWQTTMPPQFQLPAASGTAPNWDATSVTVSSSSGLLVTKTAHGLFNGDRVKFAAGVMPTGLTAGTWYYVVNVATNTFKVAATLGGSAIAYTDAGTAVTMTSAPGILFDTWKSPIIGGATFKLGNVIARRDDGNALHGINGFAITDRESSVDLDPESVPEATHPIWADFLSGRSKPLRLNCGTQAGNRMFIEALTRITDVAYEDRNGRRLQKLTLPLRNSAIGEAPGAEFKLGFQ